MTNVRNKILQCIEWIVYEVNKMFQLHVVAELSTHGMYELKKVILVKTAVLRRICEISIISKAVD